MLFLALRCRYDGLKAEDDGQIHGKVSAAENRRKMSEVSLLFNSQYLLQWTIHHGCHKKQFKPMALPKEEIIGLTLANETETLAPPSLDSPCSA